MLIINNKIQIDLLHFYLINNDQRFLELRKELILYIKINYY